MRGRRDRDRREDRFQFRSIEEISRFMVLTLVIVFFYHGGLVIYVADFVELRGQGRKAKPPVKKHVADTAIRLHVETDCKRRVHPEGAMEERCDDGG